VNSFQSIEEWTFADDFLRFLNVSRKKRKKRSLKSEKRKMRILEHWVMQLRYAKLYWHCPYSMQRRFYVMVGCPSVRPSICLSLSFDCSNDVRRVCYFAPCGQETSIDGSGRPAATAPQYGAQKQMRTVSCWQPSWRGWTQTCLSGMWQQKESDCSQM